MQNSQIHGGLLARNTAFNFAGSLVPLAVALVVTPYVIRSLGLERFGVLSLAWAILWYSSYFDLGLTRATTKFASEVIGKRQPEKIPAILWTSLAVQILLGAMAAAVICLATPFFVERVLHVPAALSRESELAFYGIGATIPFFLAAGILSALLAGAHRFDLVNAVKIPGNSLMFLLPALGVYLGYRLPGIVVLILFSRVLMGLALLLVCWKIFPNLASGRKKDDSITGPLVKFGGWVTVSNSLAPLVIYLDRFVVGSVLSLAALAYYSVPYEIVSRLQFIPGSLSTVLFPAFSAVFTQDRDRLTRLYSRSLKSTLLVTAPVALLLAVFARDILRLWLGNEFSSHSGLALQILSIGLLLSALGQMPGNLLDGVGRPDLRAKIYMSYFFPYVALLWLLVQKRGIEGAALAWSIRAGVELVVYLVVTAKLLHLPLHTHLQNGLVKAACACCGLGSMVLLLKTLPGVGIVMQGISSGIAIVIFVIVIWRFVLDSTDRHSLYSAIGYTGQNGNIGSGAHVNDEDLQTGSLLSP
jgi:O-antigen/teichoic acid export membrane protein